MLPTHQCITECDSYTDILLQVDLNLTINNSTLLVNNQTVCFGGSYSINGNTYSLSGSYSDTFITQNGCDSIVVTNLTVLNELIVSVNASNSGTACLGESVTLTMNGFASPNNTYQWSDANGVIVGATSSICCYRNGNV